MHTEQKVWRNWSLRQQNYLTYPTLPVLLWGPLFVGAPVRPNMLNMPKSASAETVTSVSLWITNYPHMGVVTATWPIFKITSLTSLE